MAYGSRGTFRGHGYEQRMRDRRTFPCTECGGILTRFIAYDRGGTVDLKSEGTALCHTCFSTLFPADGFTRGLPDDNPF